MANDIVKRFAQWPFCSVLFANQDLTTLPPLWISSTTSRFRQLIKAAELDAELILQGNPGVIQASSRLRNTFVSTLQAVHGSAGRASEAQKGPFLARKAIFRHRTVLLLSSCEGLLFSAAQGACTMTKMREVRVTQYPTRLQSVGEVSGQAASWVRMIVHKTTLEMWQMWNRQWFFRPPRGMISA